ncbi:MAG: hypothetical protein Tsb002_38150 [Wenzhouxiangellaceae bacterium]
MKRMIMTGLCLLGLALCQTGLAQNDPRIPASLPNGISAGDTTATSAILWTRSTSPGAVRFEVSRSMFFSPVAIDGSVTVANTSLPVKFEASGLRPGTRYFYRVTNSAGDSMTGTFRTALAGPSPLRDLRFGVSGDWRGELAPYPAISNAPRRGLDFFVKLGDTVYADFPSPALPQPQAQSLADYRIKHGEGYGSRMGRNYWARLQRTTSIFSMIDDHEVTNDFSGGAPVSSDPRFTDASGLINQSTLYRNGLQAFAEYNATEARRYPVIGDARFDDRPDLYRTQRYGDIAAVFILDARSFRDPALPGVTNPLDPNQVGAFLGQSFGFNPATGQPLPPRSMLGRQQLDRLLTDLQAAQDDGVMWKFVMVPEPVQNLGVIAASDRFEGYGAERSEMLSFIDQQGIDNVVFVAADIHGTVINDLSYQRPQDVLGALAQGNPSLAPQIPSGAFEVVTGAVAFDAPFGPTVLDLADGIPIDANGTTLTQAFLQSLGLPNREAFDALPRSFRNQALEGLINQQIQPLGYDPVGLENDDDSNINARLTRGGYTAAFSYGWTEFYISPFSRRLWVTTFGIAPYSQDEISPEILQRRPQVISQFIVTPQ